jgi:hypothetical protein
MTSDLPLDPSLRTRKLRLARPWPFSEDLIGFGVAIGGLAMLALGVFVMSRASTMYVKAGAASPESDAGALMAQLLVVVALVAGVVVYRRGYCLRLVYLCAGTAGGLGLVFALLPYLVARQSWLTTLLGTIVAVVFDLFLAGIAVVAARFLPLWWERRLDTPE